MHAVVQDADAKEQRSGNESVRNHLHQPALYPHLADQEESEGDEPHVRDRRIRDQLLHVRLHQSNEPDVDHRDERKRDHEAGEISARVGHDGQDEAHEAVSAYLQRDRRQHHRAPGRRLDVRIRKPCVHRPHRHLDRECGEKRHEQQHLRLQRERQLIPLENRKTASTHRIQIDQRNEHQHRAEEGIKKELDRSVDAIRAAPDPDDQVHGYQHRLEEHVEEDAVQGGEDAVDQPRHDQERRHVLRDLPLDHDPRRPDDKHGDEAVEQHQEHRDAVDAQKIVDVESRNPLDSLVELHLRGAELEVRIQRDRDRESRDCADQRQPARRGGVAIAIERQHKQARDDRDPDGEAKVRNHAAFNVRSTRPASRTPRVSSRRRSDRRARSASREELPMPRGPGVRCRSPSIRR